MWSVPANIVCAWEKMVGCHRVFTAVGSRVCSGGTELSPLDSSLPQATTATQDEHLFKATQSFQVLYQSEGIAEMLLLTKSQELGILGTYP